MLMPGMKGGELLAKVMKLYPDTVRLVLSGQLNTPVIVTAGSIANQIIGKLSDPDLLRAPSPGHWLLIITSLNAK